MCFGKVVTKIVDSAFGSGFLSRDVSGIKVSKCGILCAHVCEKGIVGKDIWGEWAFVLKRKKESGRKKSGSGVKVGWGGVRVRKRIRLVEMNARLNLQSIVRQAVLNY